MPVVKLKQELSTTLEDPIDELTTTNKIKEKIHGDGMDKGFPKEEIQTTESEISSSEDSTLNSSVNEFTEYTMNSSSCSCSYNISSSSKDTCSCSDCDSSSSSSFTTCSSSASSSYNSSVSDACQSLTTSSSSSDSSGESEDDHKRLEKRKNKKNVKVMPVVKLEQELSETLENPINIDELETRNTMEEKPHAAEMNMGFPREDIPTSESEISSCEDSTVNSSRKEYTMKSSSSGSSYADSSSTNTCSCCDSDSDSSSSSSVNTCSSRTSSSYSSPVSDACQSLTTSSSSGESEEDHTRLENRKNKKNNEGKGE